MAFKAGEIVFEIKGETKSLQDAMNDVSAKVKGSFGDVSRVVGTAMTGAGLAITGFATAAIYDFVETGSAINDMALRTGMGVEALQEFGYAAGLSGGSMDDVEKAAKKMSQVIFEAGEEAKAAGAKQQEAWAKGSTEVITATGSYTQALATLGLSYAQLKDMKPEDQFTTIGFALADVSNATDRAALAQQMFGRGGMALLPMLSEGRAGFAAMADEARRLGLIMDAESVAAADNLGDELDKLKAGMKGLGFDIAQTLVPALLSLVGNVRGVMDTFSGWRDQNPALFDSLAKIVIVGGAVMAALGPLLIMLPGLVSAFSIVKTAVVAVGAVFTALAAAVGAPVAVVGLVIANIVVWGWALVENWEAVKGALISLWQGIAEAFKLIFAPIFLAWEMLEGMWLDAEREARYGGGPQYATAGPGGGGGSGFGGGPQYAMAGGGGGGAGINMTFNVSGMSDPAAFSRMVADQLRLELRSRGL